MNSNSNDFINLSPHRQQALKSIQLTGTLEEIKNKFLAFHSQSLKRIRQLEEQNKELTFQNQRLQQSIPSQLIKLETTVNGVCYKSTSLNSFE
jgi:hypothetical protein